jgi:O-antigen/teichoic acid export membrane protein
MAFARKFLANYTVLLTGDLIGRFLAFWAMIHIAGVLGKNLFGTLSFATAFTAYFELMARQGLDTYGIQAVAREPARVRQYAATLLGLRLTASVAAFLVLSVAVWSLNQPHELKILILLSGLMFFTSALSAQWIFQAFEEMKYAAVARTLSTLIFALLVLVFLRRPGQLYYIPLFQFSSEAVVVLWLSIEYCRRHGLPRPDFDFKAWGKILRQSMPIALEGVFGVILFNFDILMLGLWRPASEVGEYSSAYKMFNLSSSFVILYATNLLPLISKNSDNLAILQRVVHTLFKYTFLVAIPLAAGGTLLAGDLITLLFGSQFSPAGRALQILIWVVPLMTCRVVLWNTLLSRGFQRILLQCTAYSAAVNAVLNLLLIRRYSYLGSSVAMVAAEGVLLILMYRQVAGKVIRLPLALHLWKPALACIPMVLLVVWLQPAGLWIRMAAGTSIYLIAAWMLGAWKMEDLRAFIRQS